MIRSGWFVNDEGLVFVIYNGSPYEVEAKGTPLEDLEPGSYTDLEASNTLAKLNDKERAKSSIEVIRNAYFAAAKAQSLRLLKEFREEDVNRDEAGRFSSGGGGGSSGEKPPTPPPVSEKPKPKFGMKGRAGEKVKAAILSLPENHRNYLSDKNVTVNELSSVKHKGRLVLGITTTRSLGERGEAIDIAVSQSDGRRKNADIQGTTVHELGHAMDISHKMALSKKFGPLVAKDAAGIEDPLSKQAAAHYLSNNPEMFAELYRLAYSPGKTSFAMKKTEAERTFSKSLSALKKEMEKI